VTVGTRPLVVASAIAWAKRGLEQSVTADVGSGIVGRTPGSSRCSVETMSDLFWILVPLILRFCD
jgi:hypothetical protein